MGRGAAANGTESTALGRGSVATGNQSIALGKGANAKVDSGVALGDDSVADRTARSQNGIVINTSNPSKSTGFNTENSVYAPVRLVDDPEALNLIKNTIKGNKGAVSVGDSGNTRQIINVAAGSADSDAVNVAQLKAVVGTIKHYNVTSKDGDITIDPDTTDPNKTVWDLKINPKYKIKYFSVKSEGGANQNNDGATATDAIAIGKNASSTGSSAVSLGLGAKALGANNTAIGAGAQAKDVRTTAIGYNATAEAASAVGIGYEAHATKSRSVAIGQDATASANNAIALGSSGQQLGNDRPNKTTASAEYAVAIGSGAVANITNGIALGSQSKTTQDKGQVGFDASQDVEGARTNKYDNLKNNVQNVRTSTLAGLSIGDTGKTRQINHLAAGTADDDAVNVAQLKSVNLAFKGDNNTKGDVRLHDQRLSVVGAQNSFITTKASDNKLEIGTKTGTIAVTEATGAVTPITTATGLVTDKTVADAIAKSGFQLKENGTLKNVVNPGESLNFKPGQGTTVSVGANGDVQVNANVTDITAGNNIQVNKGDDGKYTISATDTNTQASVSKAANSPITINPTGADNAKNYELDVAVDGTTIVKEGGKLKANLPDVSTTDLTLNEGKVTTPSTDNGKKLVNATTVANAINSAYWKATRGESNDSNDDKADNATSNVKAGDELTFVAGKNMALKKAGNTFTYGTKNDVSFTTVTSNGVTVNGGGSLTVGAGSTINMGNNVVSGVATGVADTDAVNVAQLKANAATVVAGKNVSVDVAENASTGKTFTVHSEKTTVSGTGPVTVKATSDAANHTTNYNVEFDSSKAAEQTDLTYKANGKDAKKVKLSEGLDFTNGKGTKASVGENGKVTIDANVTDIAAGNNIQVNKGDDGKYTISSTNTITTVKGKDGSAAKVTTATGSTDTNKIYEVDVNVDGKTIVNENGTLQAKGWKTKVVKGEGEVEGSSEETVNGSDTVNYIAGKNVKLVQNGKNFTIATKDNVTFKDTTTTNLSVTTGGKVDMGNNKVTNVAEGTENTDAVNVKQLKDFKSEVAEGGLTFAGNSGTAHKAKLNTTVNIKGGEGNTDADQFDKGKNVITAVNGNTVTVSIKKTPEVEGINIIDTTGKVKVKLTQTAEGLKVSDGNNNATRITNVKAGEKDTDAVNVKQLNAAKTEVTAGDNIDVRSSTGANGQTIYKVSANDTSAAVKGGSDHVKVTKAANTHKDGSTTVTDYTIDLSNKTKEDIKKGVDAHTEVTTKGLTFNADTGTTGVKKLGSKVAVNGDGKNITTTADENGVKVSMKDDIKVNSVTAKEVKVGDVNINENGINAGGKRITNVAPGKDGTDAVNVNQLKYVAGNISNQINNVDKGLRAGIAGALASGGLYHVTTAGKSMVSVGAGTYRGQNALAVGYSRLSDNGKVGVKFTVNSNSQGHSGASASVGYQW